MLANNEINTYAKSFFYHRFLFFIFVSMSSPYKTNAYKLSSTFCQQKK